MTELPAILGAGGVPPHDSALAHKWEVRLRWVMLGVLLLNIPAFYLELTSPSLRAGRIGSALNLIVGLAFVAHLALLTRLSRQPLALLKRNWLDGVVAAGAALSLLGSYGNWSAVEWALRVAFVAAVVMRILLALRHFFSPTGTMYMLALGAALLGMAGAGFYWLEPTVDSYGEGLWLAFESGATVGYGDVVPTTPASRIFAVFMVLLGYGLMSLVTASIAAVFIGRDEERLRRELHRDILELRREVESLRKELKTLGTTPPKETTSETS